MSPRKSVRSANSNATTSARNVPLIRKIEVHQLFGTSNYVLRVKQGAEQSPIMILYGDNGSGKSTLLRMVFCLLGTTMHIGHKSVISKTRFKSIRVTFSDGSFVEAKREKARAGSYIYTYHRSGRVSLSEDLKADSENSISMFPDSPKSKRLAKILTEQQKLGINVYYLSDRRESITLKDRIDERGLLVQQGKEERLVWAENVQDEDDLNHILNQLHSWAQSTLLERLDVSEKKSNVIYSEILKSLTISSRSGKTKTFENLRNEFESISQQSREFAKFGLLFPIDYKKVIRQATNISKTQERLLTSVLVPYLDTLQAKLIALQGIYKLISGFVDGLNGYLHKKSVTFHMNEGVKIVSTLGEELRPELLSSGEKQLVNLFARTLMATSGSNIFMIDEPEISLNVKWQRMLIDSLLDLASTTNVQFLLATHSIEMLSQHEDSVCELKG